MARPNDGLQNSQVLQNAVTDQIACLVKVAVVRWPSDQIEP